MPVSRPGFMARLLSGYAVGILAITWSSHLPVGSLVGLGIAGVALLAAQRLPLFAGAMLGLVISTATARDALEHRIAPCVDGTVVELRGEIVGLPKASSRQTQFDVVPEAIAPWPACAGPTPRRLRLSWFDAPDLGPGEVWQLRIKLRSVRGYQNPVGFDYEAWSLAARLDGSGTVRYAERGGPAEAWSWDRLRLELRKRFAAIPLAHPGIDLALLTGDSGLMSDADWALFRVTGTVHLMVISGLHLTIVASVGIALGRGIARLSPVWLARSGSVWPGVWCGGLLVTLYAYLAGWGVPVLRAWVAILLVLCVLPSGRRVSLPVMFLWVAAIVLTCDPLAPLQAGFWLSFCAVAVLLAQFAPRVQPSSALRTLVMAQVVLAVVMVPALGATIGSVAWVAPLANLLAVPIISVIVVPLDLLAGILVAGGVPCGVWLLHLVDAIVGFVVAYLHSLSQFDWIGWRSARPTSALLICSIACALMLLPLSLRHRVMLVPCVLLPLIPIDTRPPHGEFDVTVLDVGQGLSVVVETARHRLLYDAGPRFPSGFDLGTAVVVPNLQRTVSNVLDTVVLSHADLDHVGGYGAILKSSRVRALIGGEPVAGFDSLRDCHANQGWQWDAVRFRIVHPARTTATHNESSCTLVIDNGRRRAMLPGDVTAASEAELLQQVFDAPVDVLVAAHHGSRSSSTDSFVRRVRPRIVVFSAGFMNRFGHPHREVVCRFVGAGARTFATAQSGALAWRSDHPDQPLQWRRVTPPYWRVSGISEEACP